MIDFYSKLFRIVNYSFMKILGSFFTAFAFGFLVTPILIFFLKKMEILDTPGGRKIHSNSIPSMGGMAFIIATLFSLSIWMEYQYLVDLRFILAGIALMFFVGLRDDLVDLTAWQKLGAQMVATFIVVVMSDIRISSFYGFMGIYELPLYVSYGLSIFTVIAVTNAFNLIDGLDGLAGTVSVIILAFLGWWFYLTEEYSFAMLSLTLGGGVLSFLIFNWHPAKIFMGDTGSLSLGFSLSVLVIHFIDSNGQLTGAEGFKFSAPIATGIALLIIPLYDTARVFSRRISKGKSPMSPDKSHVHHFLMRGGLRHDQVAVLLGIISVLFIFISFLGFKFNDHVMVPLVVALVMGLGYRLDAVTLQRVKKRSLLSPPILSKRLLIVNEGTQLEQMEIKPHIGRKLNKRAAIKSKIMEHINISNN
jgi:UDP-GlcNAc:undecaprenyl-phosphate/decaprenyl-phosphate GlcNAc-1-phosphate transferase